MKSCTDLKQSKSLSQFLQLESADMYYEPAAGFCTVPSEVRVGDIKYAHPCSIACWSLAALLGVLPKRIELEGVAYELSIYLNGLYYWNVNNGNLLLEVKGKDNLVDACVDMIEKLHELKML